MKKILSLCLCVFLSALFIQSCSDDTTDSQEDRQLIPTTVGNYWVYIDSSTDYVPEVPVAVVDTVKGIITNSRQITIKTLERTIFTQREYHGDDNPTMMIFISNELNGLNDYGSDTDTSQIVFNDVLLKYPVAEDDEWQCIYHYYNIAEGKFHHDTSQVKCINTNVSYKAPAGTFHCIQYEYTVGTHLVSTEYYVPNVGMIAHIDVFDGNIVFKRELLSYQLY
jgi:hypothetical protein